MTDIPKAYEPHSVEGKWYEFWESHDYFKPSGEGKHYSITIPPPNVTGSLHIGHALCYSIHDVLIRWKRMQGYSTLCVPGTDHAGIATQKKVVEQIRSEGLNRLDIGRDAFVKRVWEWVDQYGGVIIGQLRRLGCSFEWNRLRFTMDPGYVKAVMECFVRWWEAGYIYRGKRVINWCPGESCLTAISDIEVEREDRAGKLYHLRYPFKDGSGHIVVATTRPETMLGDTAVAANPRDERYTELFGKTLILPLVGREIPLIADDYASPEFGTGAVKVTPAHDLNDFEAGLRNNLPQIVVIDDHARMTAEAGQKYAGLDRYQARKAVLADLEAGGFVERIEDYVVNTALCSRCHTVIEPLLSEQWFVRMKELAAPAIDAVKTGRVRFVPDRYERTYLEWMENIRDWTISRQLWWGHRIPVWTTDDGEYIVARSEAEALTKAAGRKIVQDEDVLDTWFSSGLWPQAVLGWPEQTEDLKEQYPTSLLITARDIIYLWVSRMIMSGIDFLDEVPFRDVYIYATVLNEEGKRMSKSLGTGVDPLALIEIYGSDALRFSLVSRAARGQDIRFANVEGNTQKQVEEARNFANKIWNASRFVLMNLGESSDQYKAEWTSSDALPDKWILSELNDTIEQVNRALDEYRLNDVAQTLYHFFWDSFCDWYIELSKPLVSAREINPEVIAARNRIIYVLEASLRLLHPLMPYLTEEIWQRLPHQGESIMVAVFPGADQAQSDQESGRRMQLLIGLITKIRNIRSEANIPNQSRVSLKLKAASKDLEALVNENADYIMRLARVEEISILDTLGDTTGSAGGIVEGFELSIPLGDLIDVEKERERLNRDLAKREDEARGLESRLNNESFVGRAPEEVVKQTRQRHADLIEEIAKIRSTLESLV